MNFTLENMTDAHIDAVAELCDCAFTTAIVTEHSNKIAFFNLQREVFDYGFAYCTILFIFVVRKGYILKFNKVIHKLYSFSHIAEAPQGRTIPLSVTGNPISDELTLPPNFFLMTAPKIYSITEDERPVV